MSSQKIIPKNNKKQYQYLIINLNNWFNQLSDKYKPYTTLFGILTDNTYFKDLIGSTQKINKDNLYNIYLQNYDGFYDIIATFEKIEKNEVLKNRLESELIDFNSFNSSKEGYCYIRNYNYRIGFDELIPNEEFINSFPLSINKIKTNVYLEIKDKSKINYIYKLIFNIQLQCPTLYPIGKKNQNSKQNTFEIRNLLDEVKEGKYLKDFGLMNDKLEDSQGFTYKNLGIITRTKPKEIKSFLISYKIIDFFSILLNYPMISKNKEIPKKSIPSPIFISEEEIIKRNKEINETNIEYIRKIRGEQNIELYSQNIVSLLTELNDDTYEIDFITYLHKILINYSFFYKQNKQKLSKTHYSLHNEVLRFAKEVLSFRNENDTLFFLKNYNSLFKQETQIPNNIIDLELKFYNNPKRMTLSNFWNALIPFIRSCLIEYLELRINRKDINSIKNRIWNELDISFKEELLSKLGEISIFYNNLIELFIPIREKAINKFKKSWNKTNKKNNRKTLIDLLFDKEFIERNITLKWNDIGFIDKKEITLRLLIDEINEQFIKNIIWNKEKLKNVTLNFIIIG